MVSLNSAPVFHNCSFARGQKIEGGENNAGAGKPILGKDTKQLYNYTLSV